ncbi:MAG: signal transduction histidine kinase [Ulvibacter sp.]|jgi:signal transduction histidine kinase
MASLLWAPKGYAQQPKDSASVYYNILLNPKQSTEVSKAFIFYENKVATHLNNKDTLPAVQALRFIAIGQLKLGYLYESEVTAAQGLTYLETIPITDTTKEAQSGLYNHLGKVYRRLEDSNNALYHYNKALELSLDANDSIIVMNNKATVYTDNKDYQLALSELVQVYKTSLKQNNSTNVATVLDNMGFVQAKLNNPVGLQNMLSALDARLEINDPRGIYSSYNHLSEYYLDQGNQEQALQYANKGYLAAKRTKSATFLINALSNLLKLKQDTLTAEYLHITDSISKAKLLQDNKYAGIKFDFIKEQKRATQNELLKEKEKRKKVYSQAIGIFIFLGSIFIYFILQSRYRKGKLEQIYKTETKISKRIHDEVANDVYHVMSKLQNKNSAQEQVLDDLENIYNRTRDISKENSIIDLNESFDVTLSDLLLSYQNSDTTIITKNIAKIDWHTVSEIKKTTLYRVLQELMTNMKKHSSSTLVAVVFSNNKNKLKIEYTDNGQGCDLKKQNGLLNTENRIETIKGIIRFESEKNNGFKATIII